MKKILLASILTFLLPCLPAHSSPRDPTREEMQQLLNTDGLAGWTHGSVMGADAFVLSYRPNGIFSEIFLTMIAPSPEIQSQLQNLRRHDKIRVWGEFMNNPSPQLHLVVNRLVVETPYQIPGPANPVIDVAAIRADLASKTSIEAIVHAVRSDGHVFVIEYRGAIFPIFNTEFAAETRGLSRQDLVRVNYRFQENPHNPLHLTLQAGPSGHAVEMIDSIHAQHGQSVALEGELVMFPQSPDIRFAVFALLRRETPFQLERTYTLLNNDADRFTPIREWLQRAWDAGNQAAIVNHRNKLLNPTIRVRARGTLNHVDAGQANPQILIESPASLEVLGPAAPLRAR